MKKLRAGPIIGGAARRVVNPVHLWHATRLQFAHWRNGKAKEDARLKLYSEILPGDFLHFGFFENPDRRPEDISLAEVSAAQARYAELVLEQVVDRTSPVLDIGCGMGGLCRMLRDRGFEPAALTPDRNQIHHIQNTYPEIPAIHSKVEKLTVDEHRGRYGTIITSESLQYLRLERALPVLEAILKKGGRWVACDAFNLLDPDAKGGQHWETFVSRIQSSGWRITTDRDITANVLPTLRYVHMWASRAAIPLMQFCFSKLRQRQPGLHYLLADVLKLAEDTADENLAAVDPELFRKEKKYALLTLERSN
jgi:cyclopropane fatty-acyl-phospholipid synthase-like methyltransferase